MEEKKKRNINIYVSKTKNGKTYRELSLYHHLSIGRLLQIVNRYKKYEQQGKLPELIAKAGIVIRS